MNSQFWQSYNMMVFCEFCLVFHCVIGIICIFCTAEPFSMQVGRLDLGYWEVLAYLGSSFDE